MARFVSPYFQYLRLGQPLVNGFIAFFENGTTTPAVTFSDNNLTTQNPLQIPLDSNGAPQNDIFFSGTLRCRVFDDNGQLFEKDFVGDQTAFNQLDLYQASVVYDQDDLVRLEGGRIFQSLQDDNQANQPETSPAFWKELPTGGIWNPNVTYGLGVVAQSSVGNQWKSIVSGNINNDPETDDGTNWLPAIDGSKEPAVIELQARNLWNGESAAFIVAANRRYQIDASGAAVDAALEESYSVGDTIIVHNESISTNQVRLTNTALTIRGAGDTITTSDNLVLEPGDTAHIAMKTTTEGEFV